MKKKLFSLLMILAMVLSLLPASVFADDEVAGTLQFSYDLPAEYILSQVKVNNVPRAHLFPRLGFPTVFRTAV